MCVHMAMDGPGRACVSVFVCLCPCRRGLVVLLLLLLLLCVDGGLAVQWETGDVQWSPGRWVGLSLAAPRQPRAVQASTADQGHGRDRAAEQHVGCSRWCDRRRPPGTRLRCRGAEVQRCSSAAGEAQPGGRHDPVPSPKRANAAARTVATEGRPQTAAAATDGGWQMAIIP
jgi:hypothetical protein